MYFFKSTSVTNCLLPDFDQVFSTHNKVINGGDLQKIGDNITKTLELCNHKESI